MSIYCLKQDFIFIRYVVVFVVCNIYICDIFLCTSSYYCMIDYRSVIVLFVSEPIWRSVI